MRNAQSKAYLAVFGLALVSVGCAQRRDIGAKSSGVAGANATARSTSSAIPTLSSMPPTTGTSLDASTADANADASPPPGRQIDPTAPTMGALPMGTAGSAPSMQPTAAPSPNPPAGKPLAMDECGLNTGYAGDEYCILPPPPDKGFQLHLGPSDYKNPDPKYIMNPGDEKTDDFRVVSGNDKKVYFYYRQFRMRPGSHHNIISLTTGGGFGMGQRIGTSNSLAADSPKGGVIAPENTDVGIPIDPNVPINVSLHSNNFGTKPALREIWVNFWYKDPSEVKEVVEQLFQTGDTLFAIQPGEDRVLGPYRCTINGNGRMLWFYGHRHANNERFSAWRVRGSQRELFYEGFNWEDPLVLEYSSTVTNRAPDRAKRIEGGWTGLLDIKAGDVLEWECHVINKTDGTLRFTNETYTGEMCIMDAELIGANCGLL